MPSADELSALPHAELAVRLAEAYQLIGGLQARVEERRNPWLPAALEPSH